MMRGINTTVRRLRRKVFEEVAALGFKADADTLCDDMEAIPYALVNDETEQYRDSVYRARAVVREKQVTYQTNIMSRRLCRLSRLHV